MVTLFEEGRYIAAYPARNEAAILSSKLHTVSFFDEFNPLSVSSYRRDVMLERDRLAREALQARVNDAQGKLDIERSACEYLRETGKDGAAKRVEANIEKMEKTVQKFRSELR